MFSTLSEAPSRQTTETFSFHHTKYKDFAEKTTDGARAQQTKGTSWCWSIWWVPQNKWQLTGRHNLPHSQDTRVGMQKITSWLQSVTEEPPTSDRSSQSWWWFAEGKFRRSASAVCCNHRDEMPGTSWSASAGVSSGRTGNKTRLKPSLPTSSHSPAKMR